MYWVVGKNGQLSSCFREIFENKSIKYEATSSKDVNVTSASDVKNFLDSYPVNHVVNASAYTNVDGAEDDKDSAYALNAEALVILGQESVKRSLKLTHFSTDYVFDGTSNALYTESDKTHPINVYGMSKLLGEEKLLKVMPEALVIRVSWLFSEYGNNFAKAMIELMKKNEVVKIVSDQVGRVTYAKDLVLYFLKMQELSGIYHFANKEVLSRYDFAKDIFHSLVELGANIKCKEVAPTSSSEFPRKATRPLRSIFNVEKVEKELGMDVPSYKEGLAQTLNKILKDEFCAT